MSEVAAAVDVAALAAGFIAGLLLGALYFADLAWGIRRALGRPHPLPWLLASFLLRASLLLGMGFMLARWFQPLSCWIGYFAAFFLMRTITVRRARSEAAMPPMPESR